MIREQIEKARDLDPSFPWHHRGYLPHFDGQRALQFVTFRLADTLPSHFLQKVKLQAERKQITDIEYHREIERFLDTGYGPLFLRNSDIASVIQENLVRFDGTKYEFLHWVVMPNHIHILLRPMEGYSLASIIHSIKSYTANRANKILGRSGAFWAPEYYDRYIRDASHFANTVKYIHTNPVKARLCSTTEEWPFGCARAHE